MNLEPQKLWRASFKNQDGEMISNEEYAGTPNICGGIAFGASTINGGVNAKITSQNTVYIAVNNSNRFFIANRCDGTRRIIANAF